MKFTLTHVGELRIDPSKYSADGTNFYPLESASSFLVQAKGYDGNSMNTLITPLKKANIETQRRCRNPLCGSQFLPQRVDQRFCQDSCRRQYTRLAYRLGVKVLEIIDKVKDSVMQT